jgi:hypothetical protein
MRSSIISSALVLCVISNVGAQAPAQSGSAIHPPQHQIASAVLPLPVEFRATATVLGYAADGRLVTLREGTGGFTCLASDPKQPRFHVACYHRSLEPFMARGRALRAQGVTELSKVDSVRFMEAKEGRLRLPRQPAALYSLTGGAFDAASGAATGARPLFVIYVPNATTESTGLSSQPSPGVPWLMFPGTPKAHIMFTPRM